MIRKVVLWVFCVIGTTILLILLLIGYVLYAGSPNTMPNVSRGEFLCASTSPEGTYTVNLYDVYAGRPAGFTGGMVVTNKTGKKKSIYYEGSMSLPNPRCTVSWETDQIVIINGKRLDVTKDTYDFRRH
ncbi:MAG: DUF5412 domain-containing protein [Propionibacteriaceae bacterium]|nr:DUF5412 domain-containing protein [Propionibacteriaceae bacterium]